MRQSDNKNSRILRLVICLGLIGGIGCFAERTMTPEQIIAAQQAQVERNKQTVATLQRNAANGDLTSITELGIHTISGNIGVSKDVPKGMHLLEQSVARQYAPAEYALGWLYLAGTTSNAGVPVSPELVPRQPARGMELLKQAASHACTAAPTARYIYLAYLISILYHDGRQIAPDPEQADLWLARNILHCQYPTSREISGMFIKSNAPTPQTQINMTAFLLLMPPSENATKLQSTLTPEAMQMATQKAEALRQAVANSEKQYPAPPHLEKP